MDHNMKLIKKTKSKPCELIHHVIALTILEIHMDHWPQVTLTCVGEV